MQSSEGFLPIARSDARVLVLGSLPGQKSLAEHEYYAHSQNAFWPIMRDIFGIIGDYAQRCEKLSDQEVALWDVLHASVRPGSMDADLKIATARPNNFSAFLDEYSRIELIAFNGRKAEQLFNRMVPRAIWQHLRLVGLPSTSPAYAAMSFSGKLELWRAGLALLHDSC